MEKRDRPVLGTDLLIGKMTIHGMERKGNFEERFKKPRHVATECFNTQLRVIKNGRKWMPS